MPVDELDNKINVNISRLSTSFSQLLESTQILSLKFNLEPILYLIPGAAQGITTVLLGHPLDTSKTRLQAADHPIFRNLKSRSSLMVIKQMVAEEGVRSLYRGAAPPLLLMTLKRSFQFAFWDIIRQPKEGKSVTTPSTFSVATASSSRSDSDLSMLSSVHNSNTYNIDQTTQLNEESSLLGSYLSSAKRQVETNNYLSGALSGALGATLGCPMHVIKIQTQNTSSGFSTAGAARHHTNSFYCTMYILREEGITGLYRGFRFQVLKDTFFAGTYLGLYETSRQAIEKIEGSMMSNCISQGSTDENSTHNGCDSTCKSCSGGAKACDVVNARHSANNECVAGKSHISNTPNISPQTQGSSISVFAAGSLACCVTWTILYPLDTLKTVVQARKETTFVNFIRETSWRNHRQVYRGLGASLLRAGPISGIAMVVYEKTKAWSNSIREKTTLRSI
eukprot:Tbor_TRINITY_DN4624_c0_g1::TRINITY_DN4624_c0_g1_i1::g.14979::m.14979